MRSKYYMSVEEFLSIKFKTLNLPKEWEEHLGKVSQGASIFCFGKPGQGKTSYLTKMAMMFGAAGYKTLYISLEESVSRSLQLAVERAALLYGSGKLNIAKPECTFNVLDEMLSQRNPVQVLFIDSVQYLTISDLDYKAFVMRHPKTTIITNSHVDSSGNPRGALATSLWYHADVKLEVKHFVAGVTSRYGGGKPFTIWKENDEAAAL
nr:MAG TPA: DNA repair protein RadA [Caudoviricetes sp.]